MNPKINKIIGEIEKTKDKIAEYQSRLKELDRQRTELENADIVAMVRGIDIPAGEFESFVKAYMEQKNSLAPETPIPAYATGNMKSEKEDRELEE